MSNDVSIAVMKVDNAFYVDIIPGRSNINSRNVDILLKKLQDKQIPFQIENEALNEAGILMREFIREFDCYPDYGIEKLDLMPYLS